MLDVLGELVDAEAGAFTHARSGLHGAAHQVLAALDDAFALSLRAEVETATTLLLRNCRLKIVAVVTLLLQSLYCNLAGAYDRIFTRLWQPDVLRFRRHSIRCLLGRSHCLLIKHERHGAPPADTQIRRAHIRRA